MLQTQVGIIVHKEEEVSICLSKYFTSKTNDHISIAFGGSLQVTLILVQYTLYFTKLKWNFHYYFFAGGRRREKEPTIKKLIRIYSFCGVCSPHNGEYED